MLPENKWEKMNTLLLECGSVHNARNFCITALKQIKTLIPFNQGRIYFLNSNAQIYDEFLLNVDKKITQAYHKYYSKIDNSKYSVTKWAWNYHKEYPISYNWSDHFTNDEFYQDHLRPQGIKFCTGFRFSDLNGTPKAIFCLDRTVKESYSAYELQILYQLTLHLKNFYLNFYAVSPENQENVIQHLDTDQPLTSRENEIADLLVKGVLPEYIAQKLYISKTTVYKHIAHIHHKLNVSTRQELLLKLLKRFPET